jgi:hypothetical protein
MTSECELLLQWIRHTHFEYFHDGKWRQMREAELTGEKLYPGEFSDRELLELYKKEIK